MCTSWPMKRLHSSTPSPLRSSQQKMGFSNPQVPSCHLRSRCKQFLVRTKAWFIHLSFTSYNAHILHHSPSDYYFTCSQKQTVMKILQYRQSTPVLKSPKMWKVCLSPSLQHSHLVLRGHKNLISDSLFWLKYVNLFLLSSFLGKNNLCSFSLSSKDMFSQPQIILMCSAWTSSSWSVVSHTSSVAIFSTELLPAPSFSILYLWHWLWLPKVWLATHHY